MSDELKKELDSLPVVFDKEQKPIVRKAAIVSDTQAIVTPNETQIANNPKKATSEEMLERRQKVLQYRLRGLSFVSISQILNVSLNTIKRDFQEAKKENKALIKDFDKPGFIADAITVLDDVLAQTWNEYNNMPSGNAQQRIKALELIKNIENDKFTMLQNAGLIEKQPERHEIFVASQVLHGWTPDVKQAAIAALLGSQQHTQLAAPKPDPALLEAEYETKKS